MSKSVEINGICKSFAGKQALKNINFSVNEGEIFGLVGLNGSGKTTLIKMMLSLLKADKGTISLLGRDSREIDSRKNVFYLPEKFQPSSFLKGEEFLKISLAYKKIDYDSAKSKIMCDKLALDQNVLKTKIGKYSKGMGQKLGLVSTFLTDPTLYILDEPTNGLDHQSRILLKKIFVETKKLNKTIFFSSHILSDIEELCDRIAIIHNHSLAFVGAVSEFNKQTLEEAFMCLLGHVE